MPSPSAACIFLSVCCPHFEDKRELLLGLAAALAARRVRTTLVLAGKDPCSHIIRLAGDRSACGYWFEQLRCRAAREGSVVVEMVGACPDLEAHVEHLWSEIAGDCPRVSQGHRLDVVCRASVVRHRLGSGLPDDEHDLAAEYERDTLRHLVYYGDILARHRPEVAVYFGGHFHQDRAAFLACRDARIRAYAVETAFVPGFIYFDEGGITGNRGAIGDLALRHETESRILSSDEEVGVARMMALSFQVQETALHDPGERRRLRRELCLASGQRMVLFLAQVGYDASITTDGGDFTDQADTVAALHGALASIPGTALFVRPHPKSDGAGGGAGRAAARLGVPVVGERAQPLATLLQSLQAADIVVTVNSQAGLQAAWLGKQVVTLGRAFYAERGFTHDAWGHRSLVRGCLTAALTAPTGANRAAAAAFLWALRRHMVERHDPAELARRILGV